MKKVDIAAQTEKDRKKYEDSRPSVAQLFTGAPKSADVRQLDLVSMRGEVWVFPIKL